MSEELDKLDRLCAEGIMGWQLVQGCYLFEGQAFEDAENGHPIATDEKAWGPTRDIAQAWEVLEKFKEFEPEINYYTTFNPNWCCSLYGTDFDDEHTTDGCYANADTAPLAIVKACLKARGLM
jgi:hypothetical protein